MASSGSLVQIAYEHTPRYENAPIVSPYDVSTAVRYMPITSFRIAANPSLVDRSDELRGIEGAAAQLLNSYAPGGDLAVRAYVNDLIFLLGLSGYVATVTAGLATLDVWTLTAGGTWTGGTFTITVGAQTTAALPYNATLAQIDAAVEALSNVGVGNLTTTGTWNPVTSTGTIILTFTGSIAGTTPGAVTTTVTGLTGTAPTLAPVHTTTGANGGSAQLPDGGYPPVGTNVWTFTKRTGITPKTAQLTLVYLNEQVYLRGSGYALSALGGNADGSITGTWLGLVWSRLAADPNLTPAFDTAAIPHLRRGDIKLSWLTGTGTSSDFTWAIANPLETYSSMGFGSYYPDQILQGPGRTMVTGTIPKRSLATADIDALIQAGVFAATAYWHSPKQIGATGYPYSMFLQMPSCQYVGGDVDPLANARHFGGSFNWFAAYDEVAGYDARFTLVTSLAATAVASAGVGL